jgi:lysozyme
MSSFVCRALACSALLAMTGALGCGPSDDRDRAAGAGHYDHVGSTSEFLTQVCGVAATSPAQGYDISFYQPSFDWKQAKTDGRVFGYARVSYGINTIDPTFTANWSGMKAAGLLRGAYQFFLPNQDVVAQANLVIQKVGKLGEGDLPVQLDMEDAAGLSKAAVSAKIKQWLVLVEQGTGKKPIIYSNAYFWQDHVGDTTLGNYPFWIANYNPGSCPLVPDGWKVTVHG